MSDKKYTDEEIVKALECCDGTYSDYCRRKNCPYETEGFCTEELQDDTIALINRQKAEIDRLESLCEKLSIGNDAKFERICVLQEELETARAEAINEFMERVHGLIEDADDVNPVSYCAVDQIAKELTEGEK